MPNVALLIETSLASGRDILRGVARYVRGAGSGPWSLSHEPRSLEDSLPAWLETWHGDGVIARLQTPKIARLVARVGVPTVDVLGVAESDPPVPLVHVDDARIGQLAATHLIERGFHNFACFGILGENWSARRCDAFVRTVAAHGHTATVHELPRDAWLLRDWESLEDTLAGQIAALPKPAGVMAASDQLGPRILEAARRARFLVPDQVAVIGVDNDTPLCEVADPPLSSIDAGHVQVGFAAAKLLDALMAGAAPPQKPTYVPPGKVVTRGSTDVLAIDDPHLAAALRHIRLNACSGTTVDAVAAASGLSRSVLQRRIKAKLGTTVNDTIIDTKLKRARELLSATDLPLADVAERTGFTHQEYLGAVFKQKLDTTPASYRARRRTRP